MHDPCQDHHLDFATQVMQCFKPETHTRPLSAHLLAWKDLNTACRVAIAILCSCQHSVHHPFFEQHTRGTQSVLCCTGIEYPILPLKIFSLCLSASRWLSKPRPTPSAVSLPSTHHSSSYSRCSYRTKHSSLQPRICLEQLPCPYSHLIQIAPRF